MNQVVSFYAVVAAALATFTTKQIQIYRVLMVEIFMIKIHL